MLGKISFRTSLGGASPVGAFIVRRIKGRVKRVIVVSSNYVLIQPD